MTPHINGGGCACCIALSVTKRKKDAHFENKFSKYRYKRREHIFCDLAIQTTLLIRKPLTSKK